jgi:hypothetical protein
VLSNGTARLTIPCDHGPRIADYGFVDGPGIFGDGAGATRETPRGTWRAYEGHRVWAAPERFPETYTLDDRPPQIERRGDRGAVVRRARDDAVSLQSSIAVELDATGTGVVVQQTIENSGATTQRVAAWGITIVRPGGAALIPHPVRLSQRDALLPARTLAVWHYTELADARVAFGRRFTRMRCDPGNAAPNKLGAACERGWIAYVLDGVAFVVRAPYEIGAAYPDLGSSVEVYTEGPICEVETLGPLTTLRPGEHVRHTVRWSLVRVPADDDETLAEHLGNGITP